MPVRASQRDALPDESIIGDRDNCPTLESNMAYVEVAAINPADAAVVRRFIGQMSGIPYAFVPTGREVRVVQDTTLWMNHIRGERLLAGDKLACLVPGCPEYVGTYRVRHADGTVTILR